MDVEKRDRTVNLVLGHLVRGDYEELAALSRTRLTVGELRRSVADYGRTLVMPPRSEPRSVIEVSESAPRRWSVYLDLWTVEEGRSDLTLEMTLIDSDDDHYGVEIDNLHVL
jgi:hypothetical protein